MISSAQRTLRSGRVLRADMGCRSRSAGLQVLLRPLQLTVPWGRGEHPCDTARMPGAGGGGTSRRGGELSGNGRPEAAEGRWVCWGRGGEDEQVTAAIPQGTWT